ncbi:MAG TPA: response regulator [Gemmatimonadales bacterium]|nr:response regulator [Gemmatimonadales bacterium]
MPSQGPAARPVDLLIASTHEWTSQSLASILLPHGYVVGKSYNRAQTLKRVRNNPPDALIIDEHLPDADGYALCRELMEENLIAPSTPVFLAFSRSPTRRDRIAALQAGAWACLGEPVDAEELTAMLDVFVPAKLDADQARSQGLIDEATGVYNVRGLVRRAEELAASATRRHVAMGCILLAPEIETTRGTESGKGADGAPNGAHLPPPLWVLRNIAAALRSSTRHSDAIGLLETNAFAVVALDTDALQARQLAERLGAAIVAKPSSPSVPPLPRLQVRGGYHGVSGDAKRSVDAAALMKQADAALQRARADASHGWLQGYA